MEHNRNRDHGDEGELADHGNNGLKVKDFICVGYLIENQHDGRQGKDGPNINCNNGLEESA